MEIKTLRFEGSPGKIESQYVMSVHVPGKLELLNLIEKPPFHICSKSETTYSTGVLAYVPHSLKLRISRDYQEPYVGIYIKISPKPDEIVEVMELKGTFTTATPSSSGSSENPSPAQCQLQSQQQSPGPPQPQPSLPPFSTALRYNHNHEGTLRPPSAFYDKGIMNREATREYSFTFFKSPLQKLPELDSYEYYESRCNWPDVASRLDVQVKISKTNYSVLVNDDSSSESLGEPSSSVSSAPYFLSDTYSDVTIQVGESTFPAHKIILSEKSRFFSRMFASSMRETNEGVVRISDEDESLFREILRFIYQGSVENLEENASELYILSDKYDVPELTTLCETHLLGQLSVGNAMEMFDLSQSIMAQQGRLAKKSKELIMWNKDKFASDLQAFKDFSKKYPEVIFELLQL